MDNSAQTSDNIHPAARDALAWVLRLPVPNLLLWQEAFASPALSGNANAEACGETLRRVLTGDGVGPQYILGLAWTMRCGDAKAADSTDANVARVCDKLQARAAVGLKKYGVTTMRNDLNALDWFNHLQEELMDACVYIEAFLAQQEGTS